MNIPITETGKRVQNYVFNYVDFLGAGNFSKCYKGYKDNTSTFQYSIVSSWSRRHQDCWTQFAQIQKIVGAPLPINLNP